MSRMEALYVTAEYYQIIQGLELGVLGLRVFRSECLALHVNWPYIRIIVYSPYRYIL